MQKRKHDTGNDNPEWTVDDFSKAVSFDKLPKSLQGKLKAMQKRGRPPSPAPNND